MADFTYNTQNNPDVQAAADAFLSGNSEEAPNSAQSDSAPAAQPQDAPAQNSVPLDPAAAASDFLKSTAQSSEYGLNAQGKPDYALMKQQLAGKGSSYSLDVAKDFINNHISDPQARKQALEIAEKDFAAPDESFLRTYIADPAQSAAAGLTDYSAQTSAAVPYIGTPAGNSLSKVAKALLENRGASTEDADKSAQSYAQDAENLGFSEQAKTELSNAFGNTISNAAYTAGNMGVPVAAGLLTAGETGGAGATLTPTLMGLQSYGASKLARYQKYHDLSDDQIKALPEAQEYLQNGKTPAEARDALETGTIGQQEADIGSGALGALGATAAINAPILGKIAPKLADKMAANGFTRIGAKAAEGAATNAAIAVPQTVLSNAAAGNKWQDNMSGAIIDGALSGAVLGGAHEAFAGSNKAKSAAPAKGQTNNAAPAAQGGIPRDEASENAGQPSEDNSAASAPADNGRLANISPEEQQIYDAIDNGDLSAEEGRQALSDMRSARPAAEGEQSEPEATASDNEQAAAPEAAESGPAAQEQPANAASTEATTAPEAEQSPEKPSLPPELKDDSEWLNSVMDGTGQFKPSAEEAVRDVPPADNSLERAFASVAGQKDDMGAPMTENGKPFYPNQPVDMAKMAISPADFQFKTSDKTGQTGALNGSDAWNPAYARGAMIFEDKNGKQWVADGHQRSGLARRLVAEGKETAAPSTADIYREKDGWTKPELKAIAAKRNMAQGTGSTMDAVKVIKQDPKFFENDPFIPKRGTNLGKAFRWAKLDDDILKSYEADRLNEAELDGISKFPDKQRQIYDQFLAAHARGNSPKTLGEGESRAAEYAKEPVNKATQDTLFGQMDTYGITMPEARGDVKFSAKQALRKNKALAHTLRMNADAAESIEGNTINREATAEQEETAKQTETIFSRILDNPSVVKKVDEVARKYAEGFSKKAFSKERAGHEIANYILSLAKRESVDKLLAAESAKPKEAINGKAKIDTAAKENAERLSRASDNARKAYSESGAGSAAAGKPAQSNEPARVSRAETGIVKSELDEAANNGRHSAAKPETPEADTESGALPGRKRLSDTRAEANAADGNAERADAAEPAKHTGAAESDEAGAGHTEGAGSGSGHGEGAEGQSVDEALASRGKERIARSENALQKTKDKFGRHIDEMWQEAHDRQGEPNHTNSKGLANMRRAEKRQAAMENLHEKEKAQEEHLNALKRKTERANETAQAMPEPIKKRIVSGELTQWQRNPNTFFVPGVDKGRILWNLKDGKLYHRYSDQVRDPVQRAKFVKAFNDLKAEIDKLPPTLERRMADLKPRERVAVYKEAGLRPYDKPIELHDDERAPIERALDKLFPRKEQAASAPKSEYGSAIDDYLNDKSVSAMQRGKLRSYLDSHGQEKDTVRAALDSGKPLELSISTMSRGRSAKIEDAYKLNGEDISKRVYNILKDRAEISETAKLYDERQRAQNELQAARDDYAEKRKGRNLPAAAESSRRLHTAEKELKPKIEELTERIETAEKNGNSEAGKVAEAAEPAEVPKTLKEWREHYARASLDDIQKDVHSFGDAYVELVDKQGEVKRRMNAADDKGNYKEAAALNDEFEAIQKEIEAHHKLPQYRAASDESRRRTDNIEKARAHAENGSLKEKWLSLSQDDRERAANLALDKSAADVDLDKLSSQDRQNLEKVSDNILSENKKQQPLFRLGRAEDKPKALTAENAREVIEPRFHKMLDTGALKVEKRPDTVPEEAKGAFNGKDQITLFEGAVPKDANETVRHEITHAAIWRVVPKKVMEGLLMRANRLRRGVDTYSDPAKREWLDKTRALINEKYAGASDTIKDEEFLTACAEGNQIDKSFLGSQADRIAGLAKKFALDKFHTQIGELTPDEIGAYINDMVRDIEENGLRPRDTVGKDWLSTPSHDNIITAQSLDNDEQPYLVQGKLNMRHLDSVAKKAARKIMGEKYEPRDFPTEQEAVLRRIHGEEAPLKADEVKDALWRRWLRGFKSGFAQQTLPARELFKNTPRFMQDFALSRNARNSAQEASHQWWGKFWHDVAQTADKFNMKGITGISAKDFSLHIDDVLTSKGVIAQNARIEKNRQKRLSGLRFINAKLKDPKLIEKTEKQIARLEEELAAFQKFRNVRRGTAEKMAADLGLKSVEKSELEEARKALFANGLTDAEARERLGELMKQKDFKEASSFAEQVLARYSKVLDFAHDKGYLGDAEYRDFKANPDYVRFFEKELSGNIDDIPEDKLEQAMGRIKERNIYGRAYGDGVESPLTIMRQFESAMGGKAAQHSWDKKLLAKAARGENGLEIGEQKANSGYNVRVAGGAEKQALINALTAQGWKDTEIVPLLGTPAAIDKGAVVSVLSPNKPEAMDSLAERRFWKGNSKPAKAVMSVSRMSGRYITRPLSYMTTTLSAPFHPINAKRDVSERLNNIFDQKLLPDMENMNDAQAIAQAEWLKAKGAINLPQAFAATVESRAALRQMEGAEPGEGGFGINRAIGKGIQALKNNKEYAKLYADLKDRGAFMARQQMNDRDLNATLADLSTWTSLPKRYTRQMANALRENAIAYDEAGQLSVAKALHDAGYNTDDIARALVNSMDFNERGTASPLLAPLFPFFNARIAGAGNVVRSLSTRRGWEHFAVMTVAGLAAHAMLRSLSPSDPDSGNFYDQLAQQSIDGNVMIPLGGNDGFLKIPLTYGLGRLAWAQSGALWRAYNGAQTYGDALEQIFGAWADEMSPVAQPRPADWRDRPFYNAFGLITPEFLHRIVNVGLNIGDMGQPVHGDLKDDVSASQQGKKGTASFYNNVARIIARGSDGLIDLAPEDYAELLKAVIPAIPSPKSGVGKVAGAFLGWNRLHKSMYIVDNPTQKDEDSHATSDNPLATGILNDVSDLKRELRGYTAKAGPIYTQKQTGIKDRAQNFRLWAKEAGVPEQIQKRELARFEVQRLERKYGNQDWIRRWYLRAIK